MKNELNSLILSNAKYKVAKEMGFVSYSDLRFNWTAEKRHCSQAKVEEQAALLAMEELAGFYAHLSTGGWKNRGSHTVWWNRHTDREASLTDLYTQYLNEKKDADK